MRPTLGTFAAMAAVLLLIGPPEVTTARPAEVPASFAQSLRSGTALEYTPPRHIGVHIGVAHVLDALAGGMVVGAALPCASRCWVALGRENISTVSSLHSGTTPRSIDAKSLIGDARPHVVGEAAELLEHAVRGRSEGAVHGRAREIELFAVRARRRRCHAARRAAARPLARRAAIDRMQTARRSCIVLGRDAVMLLFMARG